MSALDPDKFPYYSVLRYDSDGRRYWRVVQNSPTDTRELKHTLPRYYVHSDAEAVVYELTEAYQRGKRDAGVQLRPTFPRRDRRGSDGRHAT